MCDNGHIGAVGHTCTSRRLSLARQAQLSTSRQAPAVDDRKVRREYDEDGRSCRPGYQHIQCSSARVIAVADRAERADSPKSLKAAPGGDGERQENFMTRAVWAR